MLFFLCLTFTSFFHLKQFQTENPSPYADHSLVGCRWDEILTAIGAAVRRSNEVASTGSARSSACVHSQSTGSGLAWLLLKREKGGKGREGSDGGIGWMADEASNFCFCWSNMHRKNKRDFFSSQNVFFFFSILFGRSATFGDFFLLVFRQVIQRVKLRLSFLFPAYLTIWIIT
jgi:hypothetical protein